MNRAMTFAVLIAAVALGSAGTALAGGCVSVTVNRTYVTTTPVVPASTYYYQDAVTMVPAVGGTPMVVVTQPVYVTRPVYVTPAPVVYIPAPVYVAPAPVVYRTVVVQRPYVSTYFGLSYGRYGLPRSCFHRSGRIHSRYAPRGSYVSFGTCW